MPGSAAKIAVTERQRDALRVLVAGKTVASCLRQRAQLVLLAFEGKNNQDIAAEVKLSRVHVGKWRRRWRDAWEELTLVECRDSAAVFRRRLQVLLSDAPRPGAPPKIDAALRAQLVALACIPPEQCGRPIAQWTARELADELKQRKLGEVSRSSVQRLLAAAELQPHRTKNWLRRKPQPGDEAAIATVCDTYRTAPERHAAGGHTVCVDEKTGMQALEREAVAPPRPAQPATPEQPAKPGRLARHEYEYERHGTLCLTANYNVATGQIITPTIAPRRTEADFVSHLRRMVATDPRAEWVVVLDNLNTHQSEGMVRWIDKACGLGLELGKKGRAES